MASGRRGKRFARRSRSLLAVAVLVAISPAAFGGSAEEAVADGDAWYARRAEGAHGAVAERAPIAAAVAAYRRALAAEPDSLETISRLQRALFFRATFCDATRDERAAFFDEGRRLGQRAVDRLEQEGVGGDAARTSAIAARPHSADLYFWTAVCWGKWALSRGTLAAARSGAAGKVRDLAERLLTLDPALEQGGADLLLGRLHHKAPRIPFFTGWISRTQALAHLRRAVELGPRNTVNRVFLAEAIINLDPHHKDEARRLLEECARTDPRPEYLVEDAYYEAQARELLARLR